MPEIFGTSLTPFWSSPAGEVRLYHGNSLAVLRAMPARSVHAVVTSPPYWNLRDYGTGAWEGGDPECSHAPVIAPREGRPTRGLTGGTASVNNAYSASGTCKRCGAVRVDDEQIGSEETPEEFVANMVELGRAVRHVLRDDGVFWLNLGDSYGAAGNRNGTGGSTLKDGKGGCEADRAVNRSSATRGAGNGLVGIPWRSALAMQADGWSLQSDVPWVKRSAMPESCDRRPNKSLEYVFMLTKGDDYYFDMEAIRPPTRNFRNGDLWFASVEEPHGMVGAGDELLGLDVTSKGYPGAHFAVFPSRLVQPLIASSTSQYGACSACGSPWRRMVAREGGEPVAEEDIGNRDRSMRRNRNGVGGTLDGTLAKRRTVCWGPGCRCGAGVVPCVVLDPFNGSGTTAATALGMRRHAVGVDLSDTYLRNDAIPRISAALVECDRHGILDMPAVVDAPPEPIRLFGGDDA